MRRLLVVAGALLVVCPSPADETNGLCPPGEPPIVEIRIERINVFDTTIPEEDTALFRFVNLLHRPMLTRPSTVRSLLTIRPGEPCTDLALDEAGRELRALPFLSDAWVEVSEVRPDGVVVTARTQDAWSTRGRASFSSEGGETETVFKVSEKNFLGYGKQVAWERREDDDRVERLLTYDDPGVFGSRWRLGLVLADNSDGDGRGLRVERPFYRLASRWSFAVDASGFERDDRVWACEDAAPDAPCFDAEEVDRYRLSRDAFVLDVGWALRPFDDGELLRVFGGIGHEERRYHPDFDGLPDRPDLAPRSFEQSFLTAGLLWERARFAKTRYLISARRVEDLDVGESLRARIGLAPEGLSENSGARVSTSWARTFRLGSNESYLTTNLGYSARLVEDDWIDRLLSSRVRWLHKPGKLQSILVELRVDHGRDVEGPERFLLGGETGLRAYGARSFVGSSRLTLVGEHRFFAPWYLWRLFRVGLVGFLEAGGAWDDDQGFSRSQLHPGVGVGLRAQILRSSGNTTIHFNAAYPLDPNGGEGNDAIRFSVLTAAGF